MDQFSRWICLFVFTFMGLVLGFYLIVPWSRRHRQPGKKRNWLYVWAVGWLFFMVAVFAGCFAYGTAWLDWTATLSIFVCSLLWVTAFVLHLNANFIVVPLVLSVPLFWAVSMKAEDDRDARRHSDEVLLTNFQRNQAALSQLVQMKKADKKLILVNSNLQYPANSWTDPPDLLSIGVLQSRIENYHQLMRASKIYRVVTDNTDDAGVDLHAWGIGNALSSDTIKGYAYLPKPPAQLRNSLDDLSPDENHEVTAYRHIQGEWYLYYHYIPG